MLKNWKLPTNPVHPSCYVSWMGHSLPVASILEPPFYIPTMILLKISEEVKFLL